jgi:hypothetical protein
MRVLLFSLFVSLALSLQAQVPWQEHVSKPGPTGWRCHVIQPDPGDDGPDGINVHDWDGDGDLDVFVNYEEGKYSRLYFNTGDTNNVLPWIDFIQFNHGKCEDSGIGDLDNDGDIDYIANGGWVYFNPGKDQVRDVKAWKKMTLFDKEQRVPTVFDVDEDGLNDLIVGGQTWFKQPVEGKHEAKNWKRYTIAASLWPMNCIMHDIDGDGDADMVIPDRGIAVFWYENPGKKKVMQTWTQHILHPHSASMFMAIEDLDDDQADDFIITGGYDNKLSERLIILMRTNKTGAPEYKELHLAQAAGNFPKGVTVMSLPSGKKEIVVIPKRGDLWKAYFEGNPLDAANWKTEAIPMPGAQTRIKMDNAWQADLDRDGDMDILTTEENGGWGVIWFENPANQKGEQP